METPKWDDTEEIIETPSWDETTSFDVNDVESIELRELSDSPTDESNLPSPNVGVLEADLIGQGVSDVVNSKPVQSLKKNVKAAGASVIGGLPLGGLDSSDVKTLYQNVDRYKEIKSSPGTLGDDFAKFNKNVEDTGYTATKHVGNVMDAQGIQLKTDELIDELEQKTGGALFEPDEKKLQEAKKGKRRLKSAETKRTKAQVELEKQAIVKEKANNFYEQKLRDIENKSVETDDRIREYEANKSKKMDLTVTKNRQIAEINDRLSELRDEKVEYQRAGGSREAIFDIKEQENKLKDAKRKLSEQLKEDFELIRKDQEVVDDLKKENIQLKKDKKQLSYDKKDEFKRIGSNTKKANSRLEKLSSDYKEAKKAAKVSSIKTKNLSPEVDSFMKTLKARIGNKKVLKGSDLHSLRKYLNKQYGKTGSDEVRKAMREVMHELSSYAQHADNKAARAISDSKSLLRDLPLESVDDFTENRKGTKIRQKTTSSNFNRGLAGLMSVEEGAELTAKSDLMDLLKRYNRQDLITDAELNKILQSTKENKASMLDALVAVKTGGMAVAPAERSLRSTATKVQEMATRGAKFASKIGKNPLVKGLGKVALGALPLATFAADYAEAGDEFGLESPLAKGAYAAVEQLNPTPISIAAMNRQAPHRQAKAREAGKANYGSYEAGTPLKQKPDRQVVAKLESLKSDENINFVSTKMAEMDSPAAQDFARVLSKIEGEGQGKKNTTLMGLLQQPAFRELLRRVEKEDES